MIIDYVISGEKTLNVTVMNVANNQYLDMSLSKPNLAVTPINNTLQIHPDASPMGSFSLQINNDSTLMDGWYLIRYISVSGWMISYTLVQMISGQCDLMRVSKQLQFSKKFP